MKSSRIALVLGCFVGVLGLSGSSAAAQDQPAPKGWTAPAINIGAFADPSQIMMAVLWTESGKVAPAGVLEVRGTAVVNGVEVADRTVCTPGDLIEYGVLFNTTGQELTVVLSDGNVVEVPALEGFFFGLMKWLDVTHQLVCSCRCGSETHNHPCLDDCVPTPNPIEGARPLDPCARYNAIACQNDSHGSNLTNCRTLSVRITKPCPPARD